MAGDDQGMDGRMDGEDDDLQLLDTLYSLKSRNNVYLQELADLYEAGLGDGAVDWFFSPSPIKDPNINLRRPASLTRSKPSKSYTAAAVTIPEPFQLSVQERVRAPAWAEPDPDSKQEDIECYKKFRAQPVPAQVLLPLYNDIMEQQDERRKSDIQRRKMQLLAMQKPFHFSSEERKKSQERAVTAPIQKTQSVIKPIPKSVLDPSVSDRMKEERKKSQERAVTAPVQKTQSVIKPIPKSVLDPSVSDRMKEERKKSQERAVTAPIQKTQSVIKPIPKSVLDPSVSDRMKERKKSQERAVTAPVQKTQSGIKPIPKSLLDPSVSDRMKKAELLRKINSQLRAQDLLRSSSAPIPVTRHTRDPKSRTSLRCKQQHLAFLQEDLRFQPRTNPAVPDFQTLHKNLQRLSLSNQTAPEATRTKPFNLRTFHRRRRPKPGNTDREQDEDKPHAVPSSRHLSSLSPNTLPVYITDSTKRREASIRSSLEDKECKSAEREKWLQKHRQRSAALQRSISHRAKALDPHKPLAETHKHKLRENQASDWKRSQEYRKELEEMKNRVRRRAFLFEQVWKGSAVQEAERKFSRTLRQAGLTEEFVQQKGNVEEEEPSDSNEDQDAEEP